MPDKNEAQIEDKRVKEFIENAKESASFINKLTDYILEQVKDKHEIQSSRPELVNSIKFFSQIANLFSANMCKKAIFNSFEQFRKIEKEENIVPIFAVSISGDPNISKQSINLYNFIMNKPFKKQDVKDAISALKKDL